ncbi:phosphate acyltransferase PlsX [Eggerthellaceae bacterium 24-137]
MAELVTIAVDVMGGDRGPAVVLRGALRALEADPDLHLVLVGPAEEVEPFAAAHERATAQVATEVIEMGEHPAGAVRAKKDSSIVVGCRLVKEGAAAGFFSAGSTGACLAAATLVVGRVKGVKRPALGQVLPAYARPCLLIDVGANADCKPEYLVQFAQMGVVYMESILGVENPRVGLLNIGSEDTKGDEFAQRAHELLAASVPQFAGNCEGGNLMAGDFDVVVCDGFTGNVCLKTIEGTAKTLFKYVKDALMGSLPSKLGALLVKGDLSRLKGKLSPDTYGGTPLLGVKGAVIVGHGSSNETAIANGIAVAATTVRANVAGVIADTVARAEAASAAPAERLAAAEAGEGEAAASDAR